MNHATHPLISAYISIFPPQISKFRYIKNEKYRLCFDKYFLIRLTYFKSLKIVLISMATILMMSAKMAAVGHLKIKVF